MYKCQLCGNNSQPHVPAHKITIATRPAFYPQREKVNACRKRKLVHGELRTKFTHTDDRGGIGRECMRELTVCPACAAEWVIDAVPVLAAEPAVKAKRAGKA